MKNNKIINIISAFLAIIMVFSAFSMSAYANTDDTQWSVSWTASNTQGGIINDSLYLTPREKDNSSAVFFKWNIGISSYINVKVCGQRSSSTSAQKDNRTCDKSGNLFRYAKIAQKNVNYSLHGNVFEGGYPYVTLGLNMSNGTFNEAHRGYWSADSSYAWAEAPYYGTR